MDLWQTCWISIQAVAPFDVLSFEWQFIQCLHAKEVQFDLTSF